MENKEKNSVSELMETTMTKIREMVDSNSVIGEPITTPDGVTLIPVSRVSLGFGSGGGTYGQTSERFGGGGGAGVKIDPVAFLVIKDGQTRMMPVAVPATATMDRVLEMAPQLIDRVEGFVNKKKEEKIKELRAAIEEAAAAVTDQAQLSDFWQKFLSKNGAVAGLTKSLRDVPKEDRPAVGKTINEFKQWAEGQYQALSVQVEQAALAARNAAETVDITMPPKVRLNGSLHPITLVKNEIVDMRGKTSTSGVLRNQEGYSIGSIYALESLGIIRTQEEADWVNANCPQFKETVQIGDIRYADIDGSNTIDENDKTIVGSTIPRYTYSLNLDFGWKGLRLSMLFQGVGKTDGYLNTYYVMPSNQGGTFRKEHIDFACAANPGGVTPRLTSANKNNWYDSSFWMKSAAYLRLKNIQLGYDLPKSWMRKIGLKSAYVYVNAQNLFTATNFWDGYDPEVGYDGDASGDFDLVKLGSANNYPQVKLVTIGLDLKF